LASVTEKQKENIAEEKLLYEWVFHPAKANWMVTSLVTLFLFLLLVIVYWLTESRLFTMIGTVVLLGSMRSFYFPTNFKLYDDRVEVTYTISSKSRQWKSFRSVYPERNGVHLSPFVRPSRMENFRGLFMQYGNADQDKILEIVESKVGLRSDEQREDVSASSEKAE
jgi:hypothetical protein